MTKQNQFTKEEMDELQEKLAVLLTTQLRYQDDVQHLQSQLSALEQTFQSELQKLVTQTVSQLLPTSIEAFVRDNGLLEASLVPHQSGTQPVTSAQLEEALQSVQLTIRDVIAHQMDSFIRQQTIRTFF